GVPRGLQVDPEAGVGGERRQHVAEEAVGDLDAARPAVEAEREPDARLARGAFDASDPHRCRRPFGASPHSPNPLSPGLPPTLTGERGLKTPIFDRLSPSSPGPTRGWPGDS